MAWEISHAPEAWDNVRTNLQHWSAGDLLDALQECKWQELTREGMDPDDADEPAIEYRQSLSAAPVDDLAAACVAQIESHNTCSTGGHDFWIDPEGFFEVPATLECSKEGCWCKDE